MKVVGEVDLRGIKRVVINRIVVWTREDVPDRNPFHVSHQWRKTSGGPGVKAFSKHHLKTPDQMMKFINSLLSRRALYTSDRSYRCWPSGDTLNIVRKDLP